MNSYTFNMEISALANAIAQGKNSDQLILLSAMFTQLGDCLATIVAVEDCNADLSGENEEN